MKHIIRKRCLLNNEIKNEIKKWAYEEDSNI